LNIRLGQGNSIFAKPKRFVILKEEKQLKES